MFNKTLYGLNKGGTYKVWHIRVRDIEGTGAINIVHGQLGSDNLIDKGEVVKVGKQGRSPYEQAVFQAEARIKKQLDKNYRETKEELNDLPVLAMLAKDHNKDGKAENIEKGVFVSDKLDGVRCLAKRKNGVVTLESRTGQPWSVPHIEEELSKIMIDGDMLDGELYIHGPSLQEITSAVKRVDAEEKLNKLYLKASAKLNKHGADSEEFKKAHKEAEEAAQIALFRRNLEFRVFDIVEFDTPFDERLRALDLLAEEKFIEGGKVVKVEYAYCISGLHLMELHADAVSRGYEGIMYRLPEGEYESGKRSAGLWKFKTFFDKEFMIVRTSKDKQGYIVFELLNDIPSDEIVPGVEYIDGHAVFNCVMGDYAWREAVADDDFAGEAMTVQFQSRFKRTLIPQFPTGKLIRQGTWNNREFTPFE